VSFNFHRTCSIAIFCAISALAIAQQPYFLKPDSYLATNNKVAIRLELGQGKLASNQPWNQNSIRWVFLKTGLVQENRDNLNDWLDSNDTFVATIPAPGPVMIGIDFNPVIETTTTTELNRTLSMPIPQKAGQIKIRNYRSAITLIRTDWPGLDSPDSTIATTETSLASSIHPLMDPTRFQLGGDMAFEAVIQGAEIENAKIFATNLTTGATTIMETTGGGMCKFSPDSLGTYQLLFQFARPLKADPEVSCEVFTTTLTFQLTASKEAKS